MIDLSIIILSFNTKDLILQCIESIKKSKPKTKYEIIVVDNGSTDGSVKALRKLKNISLILNKENLGFSKANNQGIKKAKGRYVLLLNSDILVMKRAIDRLYGFAKKGKDVGAVAAKLLNKDKSIQPSVSRLPTIGRAVGQYWLGKKGLFEKYAPSGKKAEIVEVAVMSAYLITPRALKEVGMLNEDYFFYFEDFDYCRSLKNAGLKIYYLPDAEVVHLHGESGKDIADWANQWRRLIPSSKIYHGVVKHYIIHFILWTGQKMRRESGDRLSWKGFEV